MPGEAPASSLIPRSLIALASEGLYALPATTRTLPRRFARNAARIAEAHRTLLDLASRGEPVPFEAEWLLDNYYVIDDVVRQTREHMPRSYYRESPIVRG